MKEKEKSWGVKVTPENQDIVNIWYNSGFGVPSIGTYYGMNADGYRDGTSNASNFDKIVTTWQFYKKIGHIPILKEGVDSWCVQLNDLNEEDIRKWVNDSSYSYTNGYYYGRALDGSIIGAVGTSKFERVISDSEFYNKLLPYKSNDDAWEVVITEENQEIVRNWVNSTHWNYIIGIAYGIDKKGYKSPGTYGANRITTEEFYKKIGHIPVEKEKETKNMKYNILKQSNLEYGKVYYVYGEDGTAFLVDKEGRFIRIEKKTYSTNFDFTYKNYQYEDACSAFVKWHNACVNAGKFVSKSDAQKDITQSDLDPNETYIVTHTTGVRYLVNGNKQYINLNSPSYHAGFIYGSNHILGKASKSDKEWLNMCTRVGKFIEKGSWIKRSKFNDSDTYYAESKTQRHIIKKDRNYINIKDGYLADDFYFDKGRYVYTKASDVDRRWLEECIYNGEYSPKSRPSLNDTYDNPKKYGQAFKLVETNKIPLNDLKEGQIYYQEIEDKSYIGRLEIKSGQLLKDSLTISVVESRILISPFSDHYNTFTQVRIATLDEKRWFEACEKADSFISKNEVLGHDSQTRATEGRSYSGDSFQIKKPEIKTSPREPRKKRFNPVIKLKI